MLGQISDRDDPLLWAACPVSMAPVLRKFAGLGGRVGRHRVGTVDFRVG